MADGETADGASRKRLPPVCTVILGGALLLGLTGILVALVVLSVPQEVLSAVHHALVDLGRSDVGAKTDGSWLDRLFGAAAFVGVMRLLLVAFAVWAILSVVVHIARRRWIVEVGPNGLKSVARAATSRAAETNEELRTAQARVVELEGLAEEQVQTAKQLFHLAEELYARTRQAGIPVQDVEGLEILNE